MYSVEMTTVLVAVTGFAFAAFARASATSRLMYSFEMTTALVSAIGFAFSAACPISKAALASEIVPMSFIACMK